ncbi:MAG TPA: CPBP family intramembrane glutamic endopeptidase, partial [Pyrinomonadaceae bacterium]|nr:CPBP family intramembrane glutamic endopeptidase [Pyrinomonadaceae bacterium]
PSANLLSFFNTFIGGIWLAVAYLKTRDLWMPFGVHLSWNWMQGSVMGINVSGIQDFATAPVFTANDSGPAWLTGGSYGIEGGVVSTIALIASTALIWYLPFLKPTEDMLALTSLEKPVAKEPES